MYIGIIAALLIALLVTIITSFVFKTKGPWGTRWSFFIILFLSLWAASLYVRNVGPAYYGVSWWPMLFVAVVLSALLISIIPDANHWRDESIRTTADPSDTTRLSNVTIRPVTKFFWVLVILLVMAIIIGMANPQMAF
jgi:NADH:ubiquinone oxidoreductase subunit 6 (subunit J)